MKASLRHDVYHGSLNKPKLVFHFNELYPGYDQVGMLYLRPEDTFVTYDRVNPEYQKYLESLGWEFGGVEFLTLQKTDGKTDPLNDMEQVSLRTLVHPAHYLDTYSQDALMAVLSRKLKLPLHGNAKMSLAFATKTEFRKLAKKLKLPIVRGYEALYSVKEIDDAVTRLFKADISKVLVKLNEGSGGFGQLLVSKDEYLVLKKKERQNVISKFLKENEIFRPELGAVVEEFIPEAVAIGLHFQVFPNKKSELFCVHEISTVDNTIGIGHVYPSPNLKPATQKKIVKVAQNFSKYLAQKDYVGYWGFDVIVGKDDAFYFPEVSLRKMGGTHPHIIRKKIFGDSPIAFVSRTIEAPYLSERSFSYLKLKLTQFLLTSQKKEGAVIYHIGQLESKGKFTFVYFAKSTEIAFKKITQIEEELKNNGRLNRVLLRLRRMVYGMKELMTGQS